MKLSIISLFSLAALVSAAPATLGERGIASIGSTVLHSSLVRRDGPSGSLLSPPGQNPEVGGYEPYKIGDQIKFVYQKTRSAEATTSALNVTLITLDGKVTFVANNVSLASFLSSPNEEDTITASFKIPPLVGPPSDPEQTFWVANLQVVEYQTGSLNAAPFLAAAPRLEIEAA